MKCANCGAEFEQRSWNQRYCSDRCQYESYYRLNRETILEKDRARHGTVTFNKACPICGKHFETTCGRQEYCSQRCRQKANNAKKSKTYNRVCPICGKTFEGRKHQKYCCQACRVKSPHINEKRRDFAAVIFALEWEAWKRDFALGKTASNLEVTT